MTNSIPMEQLGNYGSNDINLCVNESVTANIREVKLFLNDRFGIGSVRSIDLIVNDNSEHCQILLQLKFIDSKRMFFFNCRIEAAQPEVTKDYGKNIFVGRAKGNSKATCALFTYHSSFNMKIIFSNSLRLNSTTISELFRRSLLTLIRESWKKNPKRGTITERVLREKIQSAVLRRFVYVSVLWIFFGKRVR